MAIEQERKEAAEKEAEAAYKSRQLAVAESANNLARTNIRLTLFLAFFTALTAGAALYQGYVSEKSANAAKSAADTAAQTLNEMKSGQGAKDTHTLAEQAVTQAQQTTSLANQTKTIADQAVVQANAASSTALTAKDALHISERAYITMPSPVVDFDNHTITVSLFNNGRIPSGPIVGEIHEATVPVPEPGQFLGLVIADEVHWTGVKFGPIVNETHVDIGVPTPALAKDRYESGHQMFVIAGFVSYTDGFPNTPTITIPICWRSDFHLVLKRQAVLPCDVDQFLKSLKKADGYPNNEQK